MPSGSRDHRGVADGGWRVADGDILAPGGITACPTRDTNPIRRQAMTAERRGLVLSWGGNGRRTQEAGGLTGSSSSVTGMQCDCPKQRCRHGATAAHDTF